MSGSPASTSGTVGSRVTSDLEGQPPAYQRWVRATSRLLDVLAVVFLGDALAGWAVPDGPPWWRPTLTAVSFGIWAAFAIDYVVRFWLARPRLRFVRTHKLDLLMVALPMLRMLRILLLLRRSFLTLSTERIAGSVFVLVAAVVVTGAVLEWRIEAHAPDANITTLGTAVWWAIVTTTTVGYGDTYPVTPPGRVVGVVLMLVGIGLIGTVSATVAAKFVNRKPEAPSPESQTPESGPSAAASAAGPTVPEALEAVTRQLQELTAQQFELRAAIERLSARDRSPPG